VINLITRQALLLPDAALSTEESLDIDGLGDSRLIFGTKALGIRFRTRKANKFIWEHMTVKKQQHIRTIWLLSSTGDPTPS
jgi:hypothetical protein